MTEVPMDALDSRYDPTLTYEERSRIRKEQREKKLQEKKLQEKKAKVSVSYYNSR